MNYHNASYLDIFNFYGKSYKSYITIGYRLFLKKIKIMTIWDIL